jgi:hypothetical protein
MCTMKMPATPEVVKPQEAKMPDGSGSGPVGDARRKMMQSGGLAASTLLTGPSGVENSAMSLGRTTLLGQ